MKRYPKHRRISFEPTVIIEKCFKAKGEDLYKVELTQFGSIKIELGIMRREMLLLLSEKIQEVVT